MKFAFLSRRTILTASIAALLNLPTVDVLASTFLSDRITVQTEGTGPDVVLIPGLNSTPRMWAGTIKAISGYRYHLVQVSGFGSQPAGGNAQGEVISPVAEEIARYIKEADLKQPA